jgi:ubiquinone/menaquinone biosynthesis C-methylase UbiE
MDRKTNTSWNNVGKWYNQLVDEKGHYYHEHIVIPGVLKLLDLHTGDSLLDIACGQGILGRSISKEIQYTGVDVAENLISYANKIDHSINHQYIVGDITKSLNHVKQDYSHSAIVLAIQNIEFPDLVIANTAKHMRSGGKLIIVINHPCFRIPRQSSWEIDEKNKIQYRRINRYLSPLTIPINIHPGQNNSPVTWTFHRPIGDYFRLLKNNSFMVVTVEEWSSDKESEGAAARMENRARIEFPLFMAVLAEKQ